MKRSLLLKQLVGVVASMTISSFLIGPGLFADAVVDRSFDDDQNELEYYWYYLDDNAGVGPNDRPQKAPTLKPSVINVPYDSMERHAFGDPSDKWMIKKYKFQTTTSFSKKCATMPFTFGDVWEAGYCGKGKKCAMPFVGLGTMLNKEGGSIDLRGVTAVRFNIKSRVNTLTTVTVRMQTLDIDEYANKPGDQMEGDEFGYYGYTFAVEPGDWQLHEIELAAMDVPGDWAHDFAFDTSKCTKLSWEIKGDGIITGDTLDIADVSFVGPWEFVPPSLWIKTESGKPTGGTLFSDFDQAPFNQARPPLNYYWYAYNDVEIGGTSAVEPLYATRNDSTGKLDINFIPATGSDGVGQGAALEFTLGNPVPKDSISILGFVGIGINLYDSAKVKYWNADAADMNAVYFEYFTDGEVKHLTLELSDSNDVGDMARPQRKEKRGSGVVNYRNFPPTGGEWKKVLIPFDSLVVHDSWAGYTAIPLDKKALAKIQWKVQGQKETEGKFAIDNIMFLKYVASGIRTDRRMASRSGAAGFAATSRNGNIILDLGNAPPRAGAVISIVNMLGKTVMSAALAATHASSVALPTGGIPAGMYFVRVNGTGRSGGTAWQSRVTIVR